MQTNCGEEYLVYTKPWFLETAVSLLFFIYSIVLTGTDIRFSALILVSLGLFATWYPLRGLGWTI